MIDGAEALGQAVSTAVLAEIIGKGIKVEMDVGIAVATVTATAIVAVSRAGMVAGAEVAENANESPEATVIAIVKGKGKETEQTATLATPGIVIGQSVTVPSGLTVHPMAEMTVEAVAPAAAVRRRPRRIRYYDSTAETT